MTERERGREKETLFTFNVGRSEYVGVSWVA